VDGLGSQARQFDNPLVRLYDGRPTAYHVGQKAWANNERGEERGF
jgi:hypothetical protein